MSNLHERIAQLSPEKRAILEATLFQQKTSTSQSLKIPNRKEFSPCPLSFAQQRLWFIDRLDPGNTVYNISSAFCLYGPLDVNALEQSFTEILRRHEILRTHFAVIEEQPVQVINPSSDIFFSVIDLQNRTTTEQQFEIEHRISEESAYSFDLSRGSLFRGTLCTLGPEEHVLILVMHHIISDGWSMGILYRELSTVYKAFSADKPSPLPELPLQYADFAVWQRDWLQREVLEGQLSYWKQQLGSNLPVLELPTDHPRPLVQSFRGARQSFMIPADMTEALKTLSQQEGVTLFITLLTAFNILLYRYTGQDDIIVGSPIANRNRAEIEALIGFFVNSLVLRTDLSGNPTFRELLDRVRQLCLGAYEHQDIPFEKLVEKLQPERSQAHAPLFQVMFALQNASTASLEIPGITVHRLNMSLRTAKFDMTWFLWETTEGLQGGISYTTDLFEDATIQRMTGHFHVLLQGIIANPEQSLSELPLLKEAERHQILIEWNDTHTAYPQELCLHQLFEAQVKRSPDTIAVECEDQSMSYQELNTRANQLASYLQEHGVRPEVLVAICTERSLEMIVGILGILKAGGGYLPLDPGYPKERLKEILDDSQPAVILTQERLLETLPDSQIETLCFDRDWEDMMREPQHNFQIDMTTEQVAYVMYTSGSTGLPKGVTVPHRAISRLVCHTNYVTLHPSDRIAHISNPSFDATTFEIWGALLTGASLLIIPHDVVLEPEQFAAQLRQQHITTLFVTTALFNLLAQHVPEIFHSVREVFFGGETVEAKWARAILAQGPPERLLHVYGPTENTTFTSWHIVRDVPKTATTIPIGRPIANTTIYLLDRQLHPVPVGVPGEIYIGGEGLARGYFNRPELTAECFVPDPLSEKPGTRLYKTGDLARYLPDGNIEFLGRLDHQVKIRGFRIELGEIEAVLGQHPVVKEAVVLVQEHLPGDKALVAYIVPNEALTPTVEELQQSLMQKLPAYMIPSMYMFLDVLPLIPSGKIDRRALPKLEQHRQELEINYVAPRNQIEQQLAAIWEDLLGRKPIGIHDNFFALGGHSLLMVKLFAHLKKVFQRDLPLATLFQTPTIAQFSKMFLQEDWTLLGKSLFVIQKQGVKPPFFMVHGGSSVARLRQCLNFEYPLYLLADHFRDGQLSPDISIEERATHYLQEIQTVQSAGPYYVGGYSVGGVIAFEMAQQLAAQGQQVAVLFLLEPTPIHLNQSISPAISPNTSLTQHISFHMGQLAQGGIEKKNSYLLGRVRWRWIRMQKQITRQIYLRFGHHLPLGLRKRRDYAQTMYDFALWKYSPQVYSGKANLVYTDRYADESLKDWSKLCTGGIVTHKIHGEHLELINVSCIQEWAGLLKQLFQSHQNMRTNR